MAKKKRPPHEQLKKAGEFAKDLLVKRGLILSKDKSAIDRIQATSDGPILPGIPSYLPYKWTIEGTRRVLYDLASEWYHKNKATGQANNITEFCKFAVTRLREEEKSINIRLHLTAKTKQFDMKLFYKKDALKGVRKLLIDSFAVAVIAKSYADLPEYLDWFNHWTDHLIKQWVNKQKDEKALH